MSFSKIAVLIGFVFLSVAFSGSDSTVSHYSDAVANYTRVIAQQGPYNYFANVSLASADWTPPAGVTIQLVKIAHAGSLKMASWTDTATGYEAQNDFEFVNVRRIFKIGTTADSIVVYGKR